MWHAFLPLASITLGSRQLAHHMAEQPADFHSLAMDAHTARWYVYAQRSSIRSAETQYKSLQLSTSIAMPFNPYRSNRVPDHLNRSRYPVTMPQQQPTRALPMRAASFDGWHNQPPVRTSYQPNCSTAANPQMNSQLNSQMNPQMNPQMNQQMNPPVNYNQFNGQFSGGILYTPRSADLGVSYFTPNQTPEMQEPWDGGKGSRLKQNASD